MSVSSTLSGDPSRAPVAQAPESAADRSANTRARILGAGERLFAERGLHGVTTHDIAREAGFASGTFYLHFRNKRELFRQLARESVADLRTRLEAAVQSQRGGPDAVRAHAEAMVDFAQERRSLIRILFSADADAAAVESDVLGELATSIAAGRQRRIASGEMPAELDPEVLSQALVGMWARVLAWWARDPSRASRDELIETLTRIQLSGTHPF